jgi:hypothetical protein
MTSDQTSDTAAPGSNSTNVVALPQKDELAPAQNKAAAFVREHPVMTLAGGLALGAVAAALIPRRNRRYVARQSSVLAEAIAAASATIAHQAMSSLDTASTGVRRGARSVASRAEHAGEVVIDRAGSAAHSAYDRAQALLGRKKSAPPTLGERIAARAGEIAGRLRK